MEPLEDERARGDPSAAQPEILDAEHRSDWCVGDEVVDHACLITVDEEVTDVVSLDDREQPPERADERVPAAGGVVAESELGVRLQQRGQRLESTFADGLDVRRKLTLEIVK